MRICLFEDRNVHNLEPLVLSRPAFDLRCGALTLRERQARHFSATDIGALVRPLLADYSAGLHPELAVNRQAWLRDGVQALVNARWLPLGEPFRLPRGPHVGMAGDQVAYIALPPADLSDCPPAEVADYVADCKQTLPPRDAGGRMIDYPWDLIEHNGAALECDCEAWAGRGVPATGATVIGLRERLVVEAGARVGPFVVADTTKGPVLIERGAIVESFTLLEGPCFVGAGSKVLGAKVRGSTFGPQCRVGGEVEASIIHGHSNKAHDGFLGHSYLGEWVNFGAGTQTSDLRNDYGPVSAVIGGHKVNSGRTKVGSFVGDHTKTGLNTLLNTGTTVGPFCNLLASSTLVPKVVPAFCSFWHGQLQDRADFRELFTTAATVMRRRDREWTADHADFFLALYDATAQSRRQLLWESEQRRLRRSV